MDVRFLVAAVSIVMAGLLVATLAGGPNALLPADAKSDPTPYPTFVTGTVWDDNFLPVADAFVNVSMYDGPVLRSYYHDTTTSDGVYLAGFGQYMGPAWAVGDTIRVYAKFDGHDATNESVAVAGMYQYVNVSMTSLEIPEFGGLGALAPALAVLGVFMALFYARRGRGR